jgi:very-short-patch-repair endonuclease
MGSEEKNKPTKQNPFKKGGLFEGAHPLIFQISRDLRKNMTQAAKILWMHLKNGVRGLKFRRQHPIGNYIADFYCHKIKLVVEIDGLIHQDESIKIYDAKREEDLRDLGCVILRFANEEVEKNPQTVLHTIDAMVERLLLKLTE